jgi:hypothetical protein
VDADEDKTVRGSDGVFEDTKSVALLLGKESDFGRSSSKVGKVEDVLDVLTASSGKKMALPGIPVAVLFERFKIGDIAPDAFAKGIDSRDDDRRSWRNQRRRTELCTVALKAVKVKVEP